MKKIVRAYALSLIFALTSWCTFAAASRMNTPQDSTGTLTNNGQTIPEFTVKTLDGAKFDTRALKGKVTLINFWATWCPPCRAEMPRLEKEIWQKYKGDNFAMVAIAREETEELIGAYRNEYSYTFPFAADPQRETYKLFASQGIPRNYVIGTDGKILYQSVGYAPEEFDEMKRVIAKELKRIRKTK